MAGLLTVGLIARRYGVTRQAVHEWIETGELIPAKETIRDGDKVIQYLFREERVEAFVAQRKASSRWRSRGRGKAPPQPT